mgnify:CR=1 FL=1
MDIRQCIIVDLERKGDKQMFVTDKVSSITTNKNGFFTVRFFSSPRFFNYNPSRLIYITHPEIIELGEKGLYIRNKHINNIAQLLRFTDSRYTFYLVFYTNRSYEYLEDNEVYITRTPIDKNGGSLLEYLRKMAAETGLLSDEKENILLKQYDLIDVQRDNVPLAQYIGDKTSLKTYRKPKLIYYPFGCNSSQKTAVEMALSNQVSIIQGPPGTGKTQTILNIISNLIMSGKSVLVVSNNNSAVENVAEKLNKEGIGFIVAKLGSAANKDEFISNQSGYPCMNDWLLSDRSSVKDLAKKSLYSVSQCFNSQIKYAELEAEYNAVIKESAYKDMLNQTYKKNSKLNNKNSIKIMQLFNQYKYVIDRGKKPDLKFRLRWSLSFGGAIIPFLGGEPTTVIASLESAYYASRQREIESQLQTISEELKSIDIEHCLNDLKFSSLKLLKDKLAKRYEGNKRRQFLRNEIKTNTEAFLEEYPVVLSTTYSSKNCISKDMIFDYVIMDEASQIDIKTGALALSCALNAVIVGDDKQLPNVVTKEESLALNAIQTTYNIDESYNAITHSFLQSCVEVFREAPVTLLREHYRCHPKIIGFCNQKFYNNELVAMTKDNGNKNVLRVIQTVPGNHAREHLNQREIDTIVKEVMPEYACLDNIGIITPYKAQAEEINRALGKDIASTVHKYQGRECDTIILSTVDNSPTEFSDDANLLNVAISRAKNHLCIVTSGNDIPKESNIGQLIDYVQYNNFDIKKSNLHSVFDLLYKQYTAERLKYEKTHLSVSEHLSENIIYNLLIDNISELNLSNTDVICHYPISLLPNNWEILNDDERAFAQSPFSHVDFLIYNSLTKLPVKTIEVDGWSYHKRKDVQISRDKLKDQILSKLGIMSHSILTTDIVNSDTIKKLLIS